ncbi:hypothetical protein EYF80_043315 [Liparis tanakae]|uniref:Uncharacterized protein n=1 Tax=Liparis tanakae TaxID=230148 RepID=A0A4Z2FZ67_9TELE|nr:hypothetical protein EYF80_043315 [Liparis tanakae]
MADRAVTSLDKRMKHFPKIRLIGTPRQIPPLVLHIPGGSGTINREEHHVKGPQHTGAKDQDPSPHNKEGGGGLSASLWDSLIRAVCVCNLGTKRTLCRHEDDAGGRGGGVLRLGERRLIGQTVPGAGHRLQLGGAAQQGRRVRLGGGEGAGPGRSAEAARIVKAGGRAAVQAQHPGVRFGAARARGAAGAAPLPFRPHPRLGGGGGGGGRGGVLGFQGPVAALWRAAGAGGGARRAVRAELPGGVAPGGAAELALVAGVALATRGERRAAAQRHVVPVAAGVEAARPFLAGPPAPAAPRRQGGSPLDVVGRFGPTVVFPVLRLAARRARRAVGAGPDARLLLAPAGLRRLVGRGGRRVGGSLGGQLVGVRVSVGLPGGNAAAVGADAAEAGRPPAGRCSFGVPSVPRRLVPRQRQQALHVGGAGLLAVEAADGAVGVPVRAAAVALRGAAAARAQTPQAVGAPLASLGLPPSDRPSAAAAASAARLHLVEPRAPLPRLPGGRAGHPARLLHSAPEVEGAAWSCRYGRCSAAAAAPCDRAASSSHTGSRPPLLGGGYSAKSGRHGSGKAEPAELEVLGRPRARSSFLQLCDCSAEA